MDDFSDLFSKLADQSKELITQIQSQNTERHETLLINIKEIKAQQQESKKERILIIEKIHALDLNNVEKCKTCLSTIFTIPKIEDKVNKLEKTGAVWDFFIKNPKLMLGSVVIVVLFVIYSVKDFQNDSKTSLAEMKAKVDAIYNQQIEKAKIAKEHQAIWDKEIETINKKGESDK